LRLWILAFVTFFSALQLFPTIPFRVMDLGGTKAQAGFFLAAYTYASAFSAPLMGALADHLGRKRVVVFGALGFVVFSILYGTVTHLPALLVVACVHGTFWSGLLSGSGAMISEVIPASRRTEGLAYWGIAATAAVAVAPPIGLALYERSWLALCLGMAALSLGVAWLGSRLPVGEGRAEGPLPTWKRLVDWRVLVTALTLYVVSFGYGGITSYVALLADERAISPRSLYFTALAVTILLTRIALAPLGDRYGAKALLYPSVGVIPLALALLATATSSAGFVVSAVLYGVGFGSAYPSFVTWVLGRTDPARRAATFGAVLFAFDIGIGSGSLVTGLLVERVGFTPAFGFAAVVSLGSIPLFWLTSPLLTPKGGTELSVR
jgi:MFS family permease